MKLSKKITNVLDIGSKKLSVITGTGGANGNLIIYNKCDIEYSGFMEAEFLEPTELQDKIGKAIENVELATQIAIKDLSVGVPSEFCFSTTKKVNASFTSRKKITKELLNEIYAEAIEQNPNKIPISVEPIYSILDNGKKIISAEGCRTSKITIFVNVIYAEKSFIELFNQILSNLGIQTANYLPSPLCETQYLLGDVTSEECIIDVGYLSTSIAVAKGKGLEYMFSFSQGGAFIVADFMESLDLDFREAEELQKNIVLSLETKDNDYYETTNLGRTRKIFTSVANDIVKKRLEILGYIIASCLKKCEISEYMPIHLTGGGISQIEGAKEYLSEVLGHTIGLIYPKQSEFNKPYYSSGLALLYSQTIQQKNSFFVAK